jgi:uncharacterized protein
VTGSSLVFDCHHHFGSLIFASGENSETFASAHLDQKEAERRLGWMQDAEIDRALIMPVNRYLRPNGVADTRAVNDAVAAYRDRDSNHFPVALGITEPLHGEEGLREIARIDSELGMVGVSYHTRWQGVATDDPWVTRGLEILQERRMLAFIHAHADSNMEAPFMIRSLAYRFPELPIIVADALSSPTQAGQLLSDARECGNIYFETSCAWNIRAITRAVDTLGPSRLLFGSDTYSAYMIGMNTPRLIRELGLGSEAETAILSGNLLRLLEWTDRSVISPGEDARHVSEDRR